MKKILKVYFLILIFNFVFQKLLASTPSYCGCGHPGGSRVVCGLPPGGRGRIDGGNHHHRLLHSVRGGTSASDGNRSVPEDRQKKQEGGWSISGLKDPSPVWIFSWKDFYFVLLVCKVHLKLIFVFLIFTSHFSFYGFSFIVLIPELKIFDFTSHSLVFFVLMFYIFALVYLF